MSQGNLEKCKVREKSGNFEFSLKWYGYDRAQQRFEKLLLKLLQCKRFSPEQCDSSKQQYERFLKEAKEKLGLYRGSYMSAHVLLNLLNELGKRDKMRGLPRILSLPQRVQ